MYVEANPNDSNWNRHCHFPVFDNLLRYKKKTSISSQFFTETSQFLLFFITCFQWQQCHAQKRLMGGHLLSCTGNNPYNTCSKNWLPTYDTKYKLVTNLSKSLIAALSSLFCCLLAQLVSAHLALISSFFHCLVTVLVLAPGPSLRRNLVSCNCLKFNTCLDTPLHGPSQRALGKIIRIVGHECAK